MADDPKLAVRQFFTELRPSASHKAGDEPPIDQIFTPPGHAEALDPDRALVVGGRGVGKSFWASVLKSDDGRQAVARDYPKLKLDRLDAALGFHEGAGLSEGIAPSPASLKVALQHVAEPMSIWQAVLYQALQEILDPKAKITGVSNLKEKIQLVNESPEEYERIIIQTDKRLTSSGRRFLLIFDALDRMASDWESIRQLTRGIAKLALDLHATKSIRLKIFMRKDQFEDEGTMRFPDSSKLKSASVDLLWTRVDLYGLLFNKLLKEASIDSEVSRVLDLEYPARTQIQRHLREDEGFQKAYFAKIAGEYMGANHRRGATYSWVHTHLADAFGETSPRSFLIALRTAAEKTRSDASTPIDHHGLRAGVQDASVVRVEELKEDYPWITRALEAVKGQSVPCPEEAFTEAWKTHDTINKIKSMQDVEKPTTPIELDLATGQPEAALIDALETLGVIERRKAIGKINVPDIFRVAADLKRRGGVPPRRQQ